LITAPDPVPCSAMAMTISRKMLNKSGESTQPCSTPTIVSNHSVSSPSTLTALNVSLYTLSSTLIIFSGYP